MFVSKKEYDNLKKQVEEQEQMIQELYQQLFVLKYEFDESKKPKDSYFK